MELKDASRTALGTAYQRAAHQLLDAPPLLLDDPLAVKLLGPTAVQRITDSEQSYRTPLRRGLRAHVLLRSRYTEDRLASAVQRGVTQYILLGAGLDTFAFRQPDWAHCLRIVEVDHAGTQAWKKRMLEAAGITVPGNVQFASIDFEHESLCEGLLRQQIPLDQLSFFSWLGVTMYLKEEAIDSVLSSVAAFPAGSEIVLTFAVQGATPSVLGERAANLGEPWMSYFEPDALETKLHLAGFSSVEFLSRQTAEEQYFRPRPPDLPVPRRINIASARV